MSLQTRLEALISAIGADIKALQQRPAGMLAIQHLQPSVEVNAWRGIVQNTVIPMNVGSEPMELSYTPSVDCWWEVVAQVYMRADSVVHHSLGAYLSMDVGTLHSSMVGGIQAWDILTQHSGVTLVHIKMPRKIYRLIAGTAYTVRCKAYSDTTVGSVLQSRTHQFMQGKVWAV